MYKRQVLVLQSFTRHLELLSNQSQEATTQLREDSKDLLGLKNLSLVQLTLVLVKLIPLELVKQNTQSLNKVEPMLLLSNSINNWRSITIGHLIHDQAGSI